MNSSLHHIRLVAGFEIRPGEQSNPLNRTLGREDCQRLATALAEDLARVEPKASEGMLVVGGGLLEPPELLRPGFGAWQSLQDLADPVIREQGGLGRILAIGANQGRLPDARLRPSGHAPQGAILALPVLLIVDPSQADTMERRLETVLMEKGGIQPPARAILAECAGLETAHGQFLTLADQLALHQIQLDTAGLGAFWPPVEHVLLAGEDDATFELPAGLNVSWTPLHRSVHIEFLSFDQAGISPAEYALWVRAFRSQCALLDNHGIPWRAKSTLEQDEQRDCLIEDGGPSDAADGLTEQVHPDCGLIAWTVVDQQRQLNYYPLSGRGFQLVNAEFRDHPRASRANQGNLNYDNNTGKLRPAS